MIGPRRVAAGLRRRLARALRPSPRSWEETRSADHLKVSVVVPVKDAGADLEPLIARATEQKGFRAVEIVIVDSGSKDGSAETAERMGATVIRIPPAEFSHSRSRNLGAERATGDYVLFTVQDALPSSSRWLKEMFSGLQRHQAAAVSCGEEPRADSDLFYRVISWNHHRFMTVDGGDRVMARPAGDDPVARRQNAQISDTACLIARELFLRYRHRGEYAEDLDLGLRLIDDGYRLAFLTAPRIVHSHHRPAWYHLKRSYVEHLALFEMLPGYPGAPGSAAETLAAIASTCDAIDQLVPGLEPGEPTRLRGAVADRLRPAPPSPVEVDHLDARSRVFVARLRTGSRAGMGQTRLEAVAGVSTMICDYLDAHVAAIDDALLREFKAALYKGWALHGGVWLASVYRRGTEDVRESLRDVHDELTKGV
jgi:GT2 family glycosyltransferase